MALGQHSTTAKKQEKLDKIENKLDDVASDVDVIKEIVTQHSSEIDRLKNMHKRITPVLYGDYFIYTV